ADGAKRSSMLASYALNGEKSVPVEGTWLDFRGHRTVRRLDSYNWANRALTETPPIVSSRVIEGKGRLRMRAAISLTVMLTTVALGGCSTMASVCMDDPADGGKRPYGGTTRCVETMKHTLFDDNFIAIPNSRPICFAFQTCDLPLSLAAD